MGTVLGHLKPKLVWNHFEEICKYPRPSKKEEKIAEYVVSVGKRLGLETLKDSFGNIVIKKPATKGKEKLKTVVLQGHIDMVCEKNRDVKHDFDKDPILPYIDAGWVKAKGTTLGADNGIGFAAALAVLESKDIEHGPIEALFTLDEETGLTGAAGLDTKILKGDILFNMDSEEIGSLYIGCAGGINTQAKFTFKPTAVPEETITYELKIAGLKGGHSGLEIHSGLANGVKLLVRYLWKAMPQFKLKLAKIEGGNKHNAIPREAFATVVVSKANEKEFLKSITEYNKIFKAENSVVDSGVTFSAAKQKKAAKVMDGKSATRIINALYAVPHGVVKMSLDIPELVETSTNLAVVATEGKNVNIVTSQRSSVASEILDIRNMVAAVFQLAEAELKFNDGYPGWKPDVHSEILQVFKKSFKSLYKKEPEIKAIHAGLECGIIKEKYPHMDMISFGPTMFGVHSPDEKLKIDTVPLFWEQLVHVLKNIPAK